MLLEFSHVTHTWLPYTPHWRNSVNRGSLLADIDKLTTSFLIRLACNDTSKVRITGINTLCLTSVLAIWLSDCVHSKFIFKRLRKAKENLRDQVDWSRKHVLRRQVCCSWKVNSGGKLQATHCTNNTNDSMLLTDTLLVCICWDIKITEVRESTV